MRVVHGDINVKRNLFYSTSNRLNFKDEVYSFYIHQDIIAQIGRNGISVPSGFFGTSATLDFLNVGSTAVINNLSISGSLNASMLTFDNLTVTGKLTGNQLCVTADADILGNLTINDSLTVANDFTVDGDTFYVDSTNNFVGINTTAPAYELDVSGDGRFTGKLFAGSLCVTGDTDLTGDLLVGTTLFYVDTTNNLIGICTTSPAFKLDVSGDINLTGNFFKNGATVMIGGEWSNNSSGDIFNLNLASGFVGIGTSAPAFDLDVSGEINTTNSYRINGTQVVTSTALGSNIINSSLQTLGILTSVTVAGDSRLNGFVDIPNNLGVSSIGVTGFIDFGISNIANPNHKEGCLFYDKIEHTIALFNDESDVTHQLGQEGLIRVFNNSGSTIEDGSVVYISGSESVEKRPTIALALADSETTARVIGLTTHQIENNTFGYVTSWGLVNNIDTSTFSAGDTLHLSTTTPGGLSRTQPDIGSIDVQIGFCINVGTTDGRILTEINPDLSTPVDPRTFSTGLLSGGILSVGVTSGVFTITDGTGIIVDSDGNLTNVSWTGLTNQTTSLATQVTNLSIGTTGNIIAQPNVLNLTNSQTRELISIGNLISLDTVTIFTTIQKALSILHPANQLFDLLNAMNIMNIDGNVIGSNSLLTLFKTSGTILSKGINYPNNILDPHVLTTLSVDTDVSGIIGVIYQDNSSKGFVASIFPDEYDTGNGSSSPGTVPPNSYTVQRVYMSLNSALSVLVGQNLYNSLAEARGSISTANFVTASNFATSLLVGHLIVKGSATDLSVDGDAEFIQGNKYGTKDGAGGRTVSRLQDAYNNSEVEPEILTDSTRGAVSIRRGSAADTDNVLEIQEGVSGTNTFVVTGNGAVIGDSSAVFNSLSISGDATIINDITVLGDGNVAGKFFAGSFCVTGNSIFIGDVEIQGGLNVLGAITSSETVSVSTSAALLELAVGNPADLLDTGWFAHYVEGGVTKFAGLFRDASDSGRAFKIFQGVTIKPDPNIILNVDESNIANFQAFDLESLGDLHVHVDGLIEGKLGVTGNIDIGGIFSIEDNCFNCKYIR